MAAPMVALAGVTARAMRGAAVGPIGESAAPIGVTALVWGTTLARMGIGEMGRIQLVRSSGGVVATAICAMRVGPTADTVAPAAVTAARDDAAWPMAPNAMERAAGVTATETAGIC